MVDNYPDYNDGSYSWFILMVDDAWRWLTMVDINSWWCLMMVDDGWWWLIFIVDDAWWWLMFINITYETWWKTSKRPDLPDGLLEKSRVPPVEIPGAIPGAVPANLGWTKTADGKTRVNHAPVITMFTGLVTIPRKMAGLWLFYPQP